MRTSGIDADFVVKPIAVLPGTEAAAEATTLPGTQRLVRANVFRGRFRHSFGKPEAFAH